MLKAPKGSVLLREIPKPKSAIVLPDGRAPQLTPEEQTLVVVEDATDNNMPAGARVFASNGQGFPFNGINYLQVPAQFIMAWIAPEA